jgi:hypothetical protein
MSLEEPRPRGTVLGARADRLRVHEIEHFFRCKACNGWIDARDRPAAAPGGRSGTIAQNGAADLHLDLFLCIETGTIAGFPRELIGAGTMAWEMGSGRQADQVPV